MQTWMTCRASCRVVRTASFVQIRRSWRRLIGAADKDVEPWAFQKVVSRVFFCTYHCRYFAMLATQNEIGPWHATLQCQLQRLLVDRKKVGYIWVCDYSPCVSYGRLQFTLYVLPSIHVVHNSCTYFWSTYLIKCLVFLLCPSQDAWQVLWHVDTRNEIGQSNASINYSCRGYHWTM